jgi:hypothetical protein
MERPSKRQKARDQVAEEALAAEYEALVDELRRKPRCEKVIEATVAGGEEFKEIRALPSAFECASAARLVVRLPLNVRLQHVLLSGEVACRLR